MFSVLSVLLFFPFCLSIFYGVLGLQFQYPNFNNITLNSYPANLRIVTQNWYSAGPDAEFQDSQLWLTQLYNVSNSASNLGRVIYADPIDFSAVSYFQTSFTFKIITTQPYGTCGSGMAFFISPSAQAPSDSDSHGALGLVDPDSSANANFFAVEFDTLQTSGWKDPSSSHMGINVNSMTSVSVADSSPNSAFYPELYLYNNYTFTVWIEYSCSSSCDIQVWMTNNTASPTRPAQPCMNIAYNLATIFDTSVYLGFSAVSAPSSQGAAAHIIYSWNFTSVSSANQHSCGICHRRRAIAIAFAAFAFFICSMIACCFFMWLRRKRRSSACKPQNFLELNKRKIELALMAVPRYSFTQIKQATHGFDNKLKIGEGGFSVVYKGTLSDGSFVAAKKLKQGLRMEAEFCSEVNIVSKVRHKNLMELQGWCHSKREAMLIYKYMANGSLDKHLFGKEKGNLDRDKRFQIIYGVASALEYLHGGLGDCVLHRDVKAANVLLTDAFQPKLSDFGLARLISRDQDVTMTRAGTPGYVAPELVCMGRATDKADVYSFGLLTLEVACGRRAIPKSILDESMQLIDWIWELHQSDQDIIEVLDPNISMDMSDYVENQWRCVLHVALLCCSPIRDDRPTMRQIKQALHSGVLLQLPAVRPMYPFSINKMGSAAETSLSNKTFTPSISGMIPR